MSAQILLPQMIRTPDAIAHPFPFQISLQSLEFMKASFFYAMFTDGAAGELVRSTRAVNLMEEKLRQAGLDQQSWNDGWALLEKYQAVFMNTIFQNAVVMMRSHWDWYLRQLGEFVVFARSHVASPMLTKQQEKALNKIGWQEITEQVAILEAACGLSFGFSSNVLADIYEMSLVRNIGIHNRWEVDDYYLTRTATVGWKIKDIRLVSVGDLRQWQDSLTSLLSLTAEKIAIHYAAAPDYP